MTFGRSLGTRLQSDDILIKSGERDGGRRIREGKGEGVRLTQQTGYLISFLSSCAVTRNYSMCLLCRASHLCVVHTCVQISVCNGDQNITK